MRVVLVLAAILVTGCVSAPEVLVLDSSPRPATEITQIELLLDKPSREFTSLAVIRIPPEAFETSPEKKKQRLLQAASKLGADAVILSFEDDDTMALIPVGGMLIAAESGQRILVGQAIVWK